MVCCSFLTRRYRDQTYCNCFQCTTDMVKPKHISHFEHVILLEAVTIHDVEYNHLLTLVNTAKNRNGNQHLSAIYKIKGSFILNWHETLY